MRSYPLSYIFTGIYYWDKGMFYNQKMDGRYWSTNVANQNDAYYLYIPGGTRLLVYYTNNRRFGQNLRCVIFSAPTAPMLPHGII